MTDALREQLAALEHEQWALWAADIARTEAITPARLERWQRLIRTPYADLTEAEKDQDREWADRVLALLNGAQGAGSIVLREDVATALAVEADRAHVSLQQYTEFVIGVGLGALSKMYADAEKGGA